jgi:hypothetical protein
MRHQTTLQLFAYWNGVRGERIAPRRFEIEPSRIAPLLPETFILERVEPASYRFRLAGTRICEQFGVELRGSDLMQGWTAEDRAQLERAMATAAQQGGVVLVDMLARAEEASRSARFEMMILPLMHLHPTADRFVGSWCAIEPPSWLGAEPLVGRTITACDVIWPDGRPHAVIERQERQVPFLPHVRNSRLVRVERRHFRVYDGGLAGQDPAEG